MPLLFPCSNKCPSEICCESLPCPSWEWSHPLSCCVLPIKVGSHCLHCSPCQAALWLPTPHRWARKQILLHMAGCRPSRSGRVDMEVGLPATAGPGGGRRWQGPNAKVAGGAFWGAPGQRPSHSRKSCRLASWIFMAAWLLWQGSSYEDVTEERKGRECHTDMIPHTQKTKKKKSFG